ncbi:hypothetical protein GCM10027446_18010 [Angustibacter peucedani]
MRSLRPSPLEAVYVLLVGALAVGWLVTASPGFYLAAAALTLPASVVAVPAFYVGYGLLALVPGASPSSSSGSGFGVTGGGEQVVMNPEDVPAVWFQPTVLALGVALLLLAAVVDVLLVRRLRARRRPLPTV